MIEPGDLDDYDAPILWGGKTGGASICHAPKVVDGEVVPACEQVCPETRLRPKEARSFRRHRNPRMCRGCRRFADAPTLDELVARGRAYIVTESGEVADAAPASVEFLSITLRDPAAIRAWRDLERAVAEERGAAPDALTRSEVAEAAARAYLSGGEARTGGLRA